MDVLGVNQEHPCLGGASFFQPYLSTALLSLVPAQCAVCRYGAPAQTVFPSDALGLAPLDQAECLRMLRGRDVLSDSGFSLFGRQA